MATMNLTQHAATADQIAAGVFDLPAAARADLQALLTFGELPDEQEIRARAEQIAGMAALYASAEDRADDAGALPEGDAGGFALHAMIGGALWLMAPLAAALREQGIEAVFAFSVRETEEQKQADGSVRKVAVFRHAGFVPAVA
jgi:hypothetical protein